MGFLVLQITFRGSSKSKRAAEIALARQIVQIFLQRSCRLKIQPFRRLGWNRFTLARPPWLSLGLLFTYLLFHRLFTSFYGCRISADMTGKFVTTMLFYHCLMYDLGKVILGKFGKRSRKSSSGLNFQLSLETIEHFLPYQSRS